MAFAFNHNETELKNLDIVELTGNPVLGPQNIFNIENNLPENRANFSVNHMRDQWTFIGRVNWYDEAFDEANYPNGEKVDAAATVDLEGRYNFNEDWTFVVGANNAFNKFPNEVATRQSQGLPYSRRTPFGYDGGFWYFKAVFDF
jgi:iron complex outermembrane receptor protein